MLIITFVGKRNTIKQHSLGHVGTEALEPLMTSSSASRSLGSPWPGHSRQKARLKWGDSQVVLKTVEWSQFSASSVSPQKCLSSDFHRNSIELSELQGQPHACLRCGMAAWHLGRGVLVTIRCWKGLIFMDLDGLWEETPLSTPLFRSWGALEILEAEKQELSGGGRRSRRGWPRDVFIPPAAGVCCGS